VALDLVALREREEVERPLIAMNELGGLAGPDVDDLRQVQLVVGGVLAEHAVEGAQDEWMRGDGTEAG
jgi:hypothetical protein